MLFSTYARAASLTITMPSWAIAAIIAALNLPVFMP